MHFSNQKSNDSVKHFASKLASCFKHIKGKIGYSDAGSNLNQWKNTQHEQGNLQHQGKTKKCRMIRLEM